ncbi:helicase-related protein [Nevskia sp.]|uniref:helicase-related protein n=1 Tax=Nevskia sp. TaxID=1929292 RepID=UPI0025F5F2CD|nr:helicase-related protein [Nevskia sp.]
MVMIIFAPKPRPLDTVRIQPRAGGEPFEVVGVLQKADSADGSRWITVHPNGKGEKGVPVLIRETAHGSGVYHVVGGAGGKLNYLKLRGVKDKADYAKEVGEKQKAKREAKREQVKKDKAAGTHEPKQAARAEVKAQVQSHERAFVQTVAQKMGWKPEELAPDESKLEGLSDTAQAKARQQHHSELVRRALEATDLQAKALTIAADKPIKEMIGEPDADPVPTAAPLGYAPNFTGRTADQAGDITAEAEAIDSARADPERRESVATAKQKAADIKAEVAKADVQVAPLQQQILDSKEALELLKARKLFLAARKQAAAANKAIDRGEQKAYVIEVSHQDVDEAVQRGIENDLRTMKTRAFLSEVDRAGGDVLLGAHLGLGATNALNGVTQVTAGGSLIDRDAVDVLGIAGAAQAVAHRLRTDLLPEDFDKAAEALERYHVDHYMQRSTEALAQVKALEKGLDEVEIPDAEDGDDLTVAHEVNRRKKMAIEGAQRLLGQALGEMEAHAALLVAMKSKPGDDLRVPLGKLRTEDAIRRLRAIGMSRGDYTVEHAGGEAIAVVKPAGMLGVAKPGDPEHVKAIRRSLDIIEGREDDPNFWPEGVATRADMALPPPSPAVAANLARPFKAGADMAQSLRDYIGGRMADGHAISDILADAQSEDVIRLAGDRRDAYMQALDAVVPIHGADGKPIEAEGRRAGFEAMADDYARREFGGKVAPVHAQKFDVDQHSADALHRSFAEHPAGPLGFKPVGELEASDQHSLRGYFDQHIAKQDAASGELKASLAAHLGTEPEKEVEDMFGRGTNPEWSAWKSRADELRQQVADRGLDWNKYTSIMGGPAAAYAAVQDHLRGRVSEAFHRHYQQIRPDVPLKLGSTVLSNHLRHIEAVNPEARERRLAEHRDMVDRLRNRAGGKYAAGSVADKIDEARERQAAMEQSQLGMFGMSVPDDVSGDAAPAPRALEADERHTLGAAAEARLSQMAPVIGQNFNPKEPVDIWRPSMTGKFINQQRAIKLIAANKRVVLAQGVGSGKTSMGMGAFAHLHARGKVKKGTFIVPSIVQGQFGAEGLRYLEPGKLKWHAQPGASRDERLAAYRDPDTHFSVVTHQAFRDDMLHLGAQHAGITEAEMTERLAAMTPADRRAWGRETMDKGGIDHQFMMVDEGHDLLNRQGKDNSSMANVIDSISAHTPYYVSASADPGKNDASEVFDLLSKMDPNRYTDRAAFMRRYGIDTSASRDQLRREMARYFYPGRISPGVKVDAREVPVTLSDAQQRDLRDVDDHVSKMRLARLSGGMDVEAAKALSPDSFEGQPDDQHEAIAKRLHDSIGILKQTATTRVIDAHEQNAKTDTVAKLVKERKGKPGVVFARSRAAVEHITAKLRADGHRVVTITGADSPAEKAAKRLKFKPESGAPEADILVASDAGAVGMNAQRGQWLIQHDTPMTAKTHAQRNGRIDRLGQLNGIELLDLVADHPHEREARQRLRTKYGLRDILTTPLEHLDDTGFAAYLHHAGNAEMKAAA